MANLASAIWQDASAIVLVALHAKTTPTDSEWDQFCSWIPRYSHRPEGVCVVLTDGGAPSSAQRERMRKHLGRTTHWTAVITDKAVVRGVVTAVRWFNPKVCAFSPREFQQAFEFVGLSGPQIPAVCETLNALDLELSPRSRVLADVLNHMQDPIIS